MKSSLSTDIPQELADLNNDVLNLILSKTDNYYCIGVCKQWYDIIIKNSIICETCNKIIKMYDTVLWITDDDDIVCHGYYGNMERYKILKNIIKEMPLFLTKIKRVSIGLWLSSISQYRFPNESIKNVDDKWYDYALKINPMYIQNVKNPTFSMCLDAVKKNYNVLKYIPEHFKNEEFYLSALQSCLWALQYIPEQFQLQFQFEKVILEIIDKNYKAPLFYDYIKNPTEDIYVAIYKKDPDWIKKMKF